MIDRACAKAGQVIGRLEGRPISVASAEGEIQRKSCFFAPKGHGSWVKYLAISAAYEGNSLLSGSMGDQWNFFAINEFCGR
jgi:hypothetical protein